MKNDRKFLYELAIDETSVLREETEIGTMSNLEVAAALKEGGLNPVNVIAKVRTSTDAMRKNAMIAEQMNIEPNDVRKRAIMLFLFAFAGLIAVLTALIGAAFLSEGASEAARKLFVLILVGGIGLFTISLLATLYVLWNAFVHKAILAEVATDETCEVLSEIQQMQVQDPDATMTQLVIKFEQNPIWVKHIPAC